MMRQRVEHLLTFFFAVLADLAPQNIFIARLMCALIELEAAAKLRFFNAPTRENFGQLRNVFLRIAAIHAERMQLHNFTRVIFIQPARTVLGLRSRTRKAPMPTSVASRPIERQLRIWSHALPVVQ